MISIIVDNYNRSYLLPFIIKIYNKFGCKETDVEMVIVDDVSDPEDHFTEYLDLAIKAVNPFFEVRAFETHQTTMNVGRPSNIGVKQSKGDILMLNHSDVIPVNKGILNNIWREHQEIDNLFLIPKLISLRPTPQIRHRMLSIGASLPKKLYEKVGGHDEAFIGSTSVDTDFTWRIRDNAERMGWKIKETDEVVICHLNPANVGCRSKTRTPRNDELVLEHQQKRIYRVNPDGWGELDTLEKVLHYEPKPSKEGGS